MKKYDAVAGVFGNGALENGEYNVNNYQDRSPDGWYNKGMNKNGVGFSFNLNPEFSTNRTFLRLYPDGNNEGTLRCIGISGNGTTLINFRNLLRSVLGGQSNIPTIININNNPNNEGSSKKKILNINE